RGAIAQAEAAIAHAHAGAGARSRLLSAQRELAAARQSDDPVEALDAARRALRDAVDAQTLADYAVLTRSSDTPTRAGSPEHATGLTIMRGMTDASPRPSRLVTVLSRLPATLSLVAAIIVVGIVSAGLWSPFEDSPAWEVVAYGLPALDAGRWWTPITGTFFVNQPWVYVFTISSFAGMAYLEWRRGWRSALGYFWI